MGIQKIKKINYIPYNFFEIDFYRLIAKGRTSSRKKVIYYDTFHSSILILKHENYFQVYWILSPCISVMHPADSMNLGLLWIRYLKEPKTQFSYSQNKSQLKSMWNPCRICYVDWISSDPGAEIFYILLITFHSVPILFYFGFKN